MDVCQNKITGKYFIYIQQTGAGEALLVTPDAKVLNLKIELFKEPHDIDQADITPDELLTRDQVQRLHDYNESRSDEVFELIQEHLEQLSPPKREAFLLQLQALADKQ